MPISSGSSSYRKFSYSPMLKDSPLGTGFLVTLHRGVGRPVKTRLHRQVMWEEPEWERWPTLKKAEERCEEWRKALAAKGFTQSDMDF